MKIDQVIKKAVPSPVIIWSPETELSETIEPCGVPVLTYWDQEDDSTWDLCTIHPEGKDHETLVATAYLVKHCYNKFEEMLHFLRACGDCTTGKELEDFVANHINDVISSAEEVEV